MPANPPTKQAARLPKMNKPISEMAGYNKDPLGLRKATKLPKARVMKAAPEDDAGSNLFWAQSRFHLLRAECFRDHVICAVIPATGSTDRERLQSARALIRVARFFAMGEAEQVEAVAKVIAKDHRATRWDCIGFTEQHRYLRLATMILGVVGKGGTK